MIGNADTVRFALANTPASDLTEEEIEGLYANYDVVVQQGFRVVDSFPEACDERTGDLPGFCTIVAESLNLAASDPAPGAPLQQAFTQLVSNADSAVAIAPNGDAATTLERFRQFAITFDDLISPSGYNPDAISDNVTEELFDEVYPGFLTDVEDGFNQFC